MTSLIDQPESGTVPAEPPVSVLVADDEELLVQSCARILSDEGYTVHTAASGEEARGVLRRHRPDVVLAGAELPGLDGLSLLREVGETAPDTLVVLITGFARVEYSWKAMRAGAHDYVPRPFTATHLRILVAQAAEEVRRVRGTPWLNEQLRQHRGFETLVAVGGAMREVLETLRRAAPTDASVFVSGECGTGKELTAQAIHANSRRSARPFLSIHCAALPDHLLEVELFGMVRSSFGRGPERQRGLLELARDGTLFLDEIPEMSLELQERLLRAIRERRFRRVGGEMEIPVTARFVAGSCRDSEAAVRDGALHPELFDQLSEVRVKLPPLRERREDIPALAERFLHRYAREYERGDPRFSPGALEALAGYRWGGNVRELDSVVEYVVSKCPPGQEIRPEHLPWR